MISDDELTRRLSAESRRGEQRPLPSGMVALLVSEARSEAAAASWRRRACAAVAGAAVIGGGVFAAPAVAETIRHFIAQTEIVFGGSEVIEDSEFVDTSASDLGEYLESIYPAQLQLAPRQTKKGLIEQVRAAHSAEPGVTQRVGLIRSFEHAAYVGWIEEWLTAHDAGDKTRMAAAAKVISDAATWPAFVQTDGGGITYIMARFGKEISAEDVQAAQELAQIEGASGWDGVDRSNRPDSYYETFLNDYEASK